MTPKTDRAQPTRRFAEYTVSRDSGLDLGITSLPWSKMRRALGPSLTTGDAVVDLGQSFNFDGRVYGRAMLNPNGYIALGVTSSLQLMGSEGDNTTLSSSLTPSGSVLLAPWFSQLATATTADSPYGGVWYACEHGHDGVQTVIRWHCRCAPDTSNPATLNLLTFECVLRSGGEVQFRYAPFVQGTRGATETGAAIGAFVTGTNVFRDMARDNTHLGGAVYTSGFSDGSSPFRRSLSTAQGWPGGTLLGSVWSLQPRRLRRLGAPRLEVREAERRTSVPFVALSGRSTHRSVFDDRSAVAFTSGVVNLPTTLPRWAAVAWPGGVALEDVYTDVDVTASVAPSAVMSWRAERPSRPLAPFSEISLPEQSTSTFFATGTALVEAGGLASPLRSKSVIRIELPVVFETAMSSQTASLYYYDAGSRKMTLAGAASRESPSTVLALASDAQLFGPTGHALISGSCCTSGSFELSPFQLSHPFVGVAPTKQTVEAAMQYAQTGSATLSVVHDPASDGLMPIMMNKYIDAPFLVEKAVIELPIAAGAGWFDDRTRTVMDNIPIGAILGHELSADMGGPCITVALLNCMSDRREIVLSGTIVPSGDNAARSTFTYYTTGGLMSPTTVYEHTLEGFLPYGGTPTAVVTSDAASQFTGTVNLEVEARSCNGYLVLANGRNYFETLSSSVGYMAAEVGRDVVDLASPSPGAYFLHSIGPFGRAKTGFDPSGRSFLGRDHVGPSYMRGTVFGVVNPFAAVRTEALAQLAGSSFFTGSYQVLPNAGMFVGGSSVSPYLLQPTDRVVFAAAKHRPARSASSRTVSSGAVDMRAHPYTGALTGSHDVKFVTGTIRISLYGAHLAQSVEHHGSMRQGLGSACAFELAAGGEAVLDQFEVEPRSALSGGLFDDFITGSMVQARARFGELAGSKRLVVGRRERVFSVVNARAAGSGGLSDGSVSTKSMQAWELAGMLRSSQCVSTERLYDSMVPPYEAIARLNGSRVVSYVDPALPTLTGAWVFLDAYAQGKDGDVPLGSTDLDWSWAYPFEPRYSSLVRQAGLQRHVTTRGNYNGTSVTATSGRPAAALIVAAATEITNENSVDYVTVCDFVSGVVPGAQGVAPSADVVKALYGFGDSNLRHVYSGSQAIGPTHFPTFRARISGSANRSSHAFSASPIIRGWKYGLASGLALNGRAIFRRGRFGQFRDMLEQRLDTKHLVPARKGTSVTASPVVVRFFAYPTSGSGPVPTQPWETSSSNVSLEATSSLPYFDGVARN